MISMNDQRSALPRAGLLCGCRKVNELVPNVLLARFHNESLPSLFDFVCGGVEAEGDAPSERLDWYESECSDILAVNAIK